MKKLMGFLSAGLFVLFLAGSAFPANWSDSLYYGQWFLGSDRATSIVVGATDEIIVNVNIANQTVSNNVAFNGFQNCRYISCDVAGIIKIGIRDTWGNEKIVVMQMTAGVMYQIRNVISVYKNYIGTTACTASSYHESGGLYVGIHLWR